VVAVTSKGARYLALRPTLAEYVLEMPRGAQIIYPKDLATIALFADVGPGQTVVEAGLGSGALTLVLLRLVGPTGRVVSYEMREEFARRAQRNIEARLGPGVALTVRPQDIYLGIEEREVDRVVLDLPEPWRLVEPAARALRAGGIFCAYVPTIPSPSASTRRSRAPGVRARRDLRDPPPTLEHRRPSVRPAHRMVAHTGFHPGPPGQPDAGGSESTRRRARRDATRNPPGPEGVMLQLFRLRARLDGRAGLVSLTTFMVMATSSENDAIGSRGCPRSSRGACRSRRPSRRRAWSRRWPRRRWGSSRTTRWRSHPAWG
jgi:tRNA (adenine57-N1/adenine58-N1)-methyltransferase